jgi:hypothetical protein
MPALADGHDHDNERSYSRTYPSNAFRHGHDHGRDHGRFGHWDRGRHHGWYGYHGRERDRLGFWLGVLGHSHGLYGDRHHGHYLGRR